MENKLVLLQFDDKIRVVRYDKRNLQIQEYRPDKVKGSDVKVTKWSNDDCFYGSMKGALSAIVKKKLRSSTINDIATLIEMIHILNKRIDEIELKGE